MLKKSFPKKIFAAILLALCVTPTLTMSFAPTIVVAQTSATQTPATKTPAVATPPVRNIPTRKAPVRKTPVQTPVITPTPASLPEEVAEQGERILSFDAKYDVARDRSAKVVETIRYDFSAERKHGLYRDIPYQYNNNGGTKQLEIHVLSVTDSAGKPWQYEVSRIQGFVRVKIGDANAFVTGQQTYVIAYTVEDAILFFPEQDEFYWNVTGDGWNIPILSASATITLPDPPLNTLCYTGPRGSRASDCVMRTEGNVVRGSLKNGTTGSRALASGLNVQEGFTVVVALPKGSVMPPSAAEQAWDAFKQDGGLLLPVIALVVMFTLWWTRGRDPTMSKYIAPMYDAPDRLSPGEMGVVWDESADKHDISATMIDLAVRGYIRIKEVQETKFLLFKGKDYVFTKLKESDHALRNFEKTLLSGVFAHDETVHDKAAHDKTEVRLSALKHHFYKTNERVVNTLLENVTKHGYFVANPVQTKAKYAVAGLVCGIAGVFGGILTESISLGIGLVLSGVIIAAVGYAMPRRTMKGTKAKMHIAGLKLYLTRAEQKQLKFHNAPEKKPEVFEKLLPYAIALRVEEAWARQFEGIFDTSPEWYQSAHPGSFTLGYMMGSLHSFAYAAEATLPARPSSSGGSGFGGGGFSGGGFGGGGGGSW